MLSAAIFRQDVNKKCLNFFYFAKKAYVYHLKYLARVLLISKEYPQYTTQNISEVFLPDSMHSISSLIFIFSTKTYADKTPDDKLLIYFSYFSQQIGEICMKCQILTLFLGKLTVL